MENNDRTSQFTQVVKEKDDLELVKSYIKRADYQKDFVDVLEGELRLRGYDTEDIVKDNNPFLSFTKHATNKALIDVYLDPRGYSDEEANSAKEELVRRGVDLSGLCKEQHVERKGKRIVLGYLIVLLSPIVFGVLFWALFGIDGIIPGSIVCIICAIIGLFIGLKYFTSKIETGSGRKFEYKKGTRINGLIISLLALLVIVANVKNLLSM